MAFSRQDFERCCRLCAQEQDVTVMLFTKEAEAMSLQTKLNKYLLIEVDEDDKLPQHICIDCCTKLQTVCDFIDTVHKSQEELLNRRHVLDHTATDDSYINYSKQDIKEETESYSDDEGKHTGMEVHVDPMMVLENSDEPFLPTSDDHTETTNSEECEDVTYLHRVDSDKVTIKLIRKADSSITKSAGDTNTKLVSCDICKMRFKSDVALKKHLQFHLNETSSETQFKCDTCYKEFEVKTDLVQHLKDHNSKGMCQLCGRMFRSEKTYSAHMDEHLSDTSYACEVCGRSYSTEGHLKTHSVTHSTERPYHDIDDHTETTNSEECDDVTYLHRVDSDKVTIKLIRKADSSITKSAGDTNTKLVSCDICKMRFKSDVALKKHLQFHLNETSSETQFKCDTCYREFEVKTDLVQHLKDHNSKGMCQLCGRMFRSEKTYSAHMDEHLSDTSYACEVCGRTYSTEGHLKTHSVTHSTERPYHCNFCDKKFKRNQDLKFHTNQHTGNKPYQCPFCEKCFASSGNCYSHRNRIHPDRNKSVPLRFSQRKDNQGLLALAPKPALTTVKGIFKYQCQLCDHSFMKRDNFTYHMYQHTGEKPFQCTFCTEKFMTRRGLLLHHDKIHPTQDRPLALLTKNVLLK